MKQLNEDETEAERREFYKEKNKDLKKEEPITYEGFIVRPRIPFRIGK